MTFHERADHHRMKGTQVVTERDALRRSYNGESSCSESRPWRTRFIWDMACEGEAYKCFTWIT